MDKYLHLFNGIKQESPIKEKKKEEYYPTFVKAMNEIGYEGYYSYELCHPLPVVNSEKVGMDFVDGCASLACKMMKGLVS